MEDSVSYPELKNLLSQVPAKTLNYSSRNILSNNLDVKQVLPSKYGCSRDYRGLADLMDFGYNDIKMFERGKDSPTFQILEAWGSRCNSTLDKLIEILEEMERHDIIKELIHSLERTAKTYFEKQKLQEFPIQDPEVTSCPVSRHPEIDSQVYTLDDVKSGECTYYDAYVSYADEDRSFVQHLAKILESPEIGLKLFIRGRDLLLGYAEHDTNIMIIKERCRRMLIILSPNFLNSPACEFQASFAAGLAIDQKQRMLIPIVYSSCETPLILKYVSKIDFTKPDIQEWVWEKLISSLLPEGKSSMFIPSIEDNFQQKNNILQSSTPKPSLASANDALSPMITYPPSTKLLPYSVNNTSISVASAVESGNDLKNSTIPAKTANVPKRWKFPWSSHLKERFTNAYSNRSISSSSSATSGFHSQSGNTFEYMESSEDCSGDTPV